MPSMNVEQLRSEILDLVRVDDQEPVGHLIDALVAWSQATGLKHEPPTGADPVLKFRPLEGGPEVWAIYPSKRLGGAKLSLVPGLTDHAGSLRESVRALGFHESDLKSEKLDLPLGDLAGRADWGPVFQLMSLAVEHLKTRA